MIKVSGAMITGAALVGAGIGIISASIEQQVRRDVWAEAEKFVTDGTKEETTA